MRPAENGASLALVRRGGELGSCPASPGVIVDEHVTELDTPTQLAEEQRPFGLATCQADVLPALGDVRLSSKLPFVKLHR